MKNYLKESAIRSKALLLEATQHSLFGIDIILKDQLSNGINISEVIDAIRKIIPRIYVDVLRENIDIIYVGDFPILKDRRLSALFLERAIYAKNEQKTALDMAYAIIHEMSHAIMEHFEEEINNGSRLTEEYETKILEFYSRLVDSNVKLPDDILNIMLDDQNTNKFDNYLYGILGYENVFKISHDLFINPYAMVSAEEYFATGFEEFYAGNRKLLGEISPALLEMIVFVEKIVSEEDR